MIQWDSTPLHVSLVSKTSITRFSQPIHSDSIVVPGGRSADALAGRALATEELVGRAAETAKSRSVTRGRSFQVHALGRFVRFGIWPYGGCWSRQKLHVGNRRES